VREGDILMRLAGEDLEELRAFSDVLKKLEPGQEVEATVLRDGKRVTLKATVQAR